MVNINKNFSELPLRTGVGIVLLNSDNKVFVARRIDNAKKFWQMPQGGVDEGEDFLKAAYRELEEETGIKVSPNDLVFCKTIYKGWCIFKSCSTTIYN